MRGSTMSGTKGIRLELDGQLLQSEMLLRQEMRGLSAMIGRRGVRKKSFGA